MIKLRLGLITHASKNKPEPWVMLQKEMLGIKVADKDEATMIDWKEKRSML